MQTTLKESKSISATRIALLAALDATALTRFAPHWASLAPGLAHPHRWVAQVGPDQACAALAAALLWLACCWLGLGLGVAAIGCAPGGVGRVAGLLSQRMLPRTLQRIIVTAAGASIVWSPVAALADTPSTAPGASTSIVLRLPTDAVSAGPSAGQSTAATAAPTTPATPEAPTTPTTPTTPATPAAPATPAQPTVATPTAPQSTTPRHPAASVTVAPGDSLWQITANRLGPAATPAKVAAAWPQLYAANRGVIGTDPGLVRPGQTLVVPAEIEAQS